MGLGILFPGQGSQHVGMGADLFDKRPDLLGGRADERLGWSLRQLCLNGPEEMLTRTEYAQPALFAVGYALWEEFRSGLLTLPVAAAGHSLGEFTALAASGMIDYDDGLDLVTIRGKSMAAAADREPSGMVAVLSADLDKAEEAASLRRSEGGRLYVANINSPGQIVMGGGSKDLAWLESVASKWGFRRVVPLKVAGAFHTPFMAEATEPVGRAMKAVDWQPPSFPVWSNVTAQPAPADGVATLLVDQIVSPVRFSECLTGMAASGVSVFVHVGPGDVTAGLARRSVPSARTLVVNQLQVMASVVAEIGTMN
jgi:[acyl-carrier-protein] S-malonyltransferase